MAQQASKHWDFEGDVVGAPPAGFSFARTGQGRPGKWVIAVDDDGTSARRHVLAQLDADETGGRFPVAVADAPVVKDVRVAVRCKAMSGRVDQACGIVLRYQDENNYYVARANALEDNVRLYHVSSGRRRQFAGWDGRIVPRAWHTLAVEARGDEFDVFWDGQRVIHANDETFAGAGRLGLWTKSDSVSYFHGLSVDEL